MSKSIAEKAKCHIESSFSQRVCSNSAVLTTWIVHNCKPVWRLPLHAVLVWLRLAYHSFIRIVSKTVRCQVAHLPEKSCFLPKTGSKIFFVQAERTHKMRRLLTICLFVRNQLVSSMQIHYELNEYFDDEFAIMNFTHKILGTNSCSTNTEIAQIISDCTARWQCKPVCDDNIAVNTCSRGKLWPMELTQHNIERYLISGGCNSSTSTQL